MRGTLLEMAMLVLVCLGMSWPSTGAAAEEPAPSQPAGSEAGDSPVADSQVLFRIQVVELTRALLRSAGVELEQPNGMIENGAAIAKLVNSLVEQKRARIVAEPNLVTKVGHIGKYHAGGQFPVAIPQDGKKKIIYHNYGTEIDLRPLAVQQGKLSVHLQIRISEIDAAQQDGGNISPDHPPKLRSCSLSTAFEAVPAQTYVAQLQDPSQFKATAGQQINPGKASLPGDKFRLVLITAELMQAVASQPASAAAPR